MPNRLAAAKSLYLRKHADNPIDWWPWSEAALATAERENKPIFLSIGYSSCHWCTVMEGEAFSNGAIADYLNAQFLPIKVDREERPDIDSIYMQALQMMTGQGGWPLNIFLTPGDLVPFYVGTYFPAEPRYGRPGFFQVLQSVRQYYDLEKTKLQTIKTEMLANLQGMTRLEPVPELSRTVFQQGMEYNTGVVSGGGMGPSFPMIPYAEVAQRASRLPLESRYDAPKLSLQRGMDLSLGGIFDHVAGGFHRYTVDSTWTVPHFEKMLYDNGQIMEYLANLWSAGAREPAFERAIALTVQWLQREMTAPDGYFYAAQDADSFATAAAAEPEEGAFYVWAYSQLKALLDEATLTALETDFTVTLAGNFEGQIVLQRRHPGALSEATEQGLATLFEARYGTRDRQTPFPPARNNQEAKTQPWPGRIPAVTDTKMIVAWNSLMISGLARAATVWHQPDWLNLAIAAAQFCLTQQRVEGRFQRVNYAGQAAVVAQAEDYALFIKALVDLHQAELAIAATDPTPWLEHALRLQAEFDEHLWSEEAGGYFGTDSRPDLLIRERSYMDSATPAANGVAVSNLIRLALLSDDLTYLDRAEQTLQAFGSVLERSPQACPSLFSAWDWYYHQTLVRTSRDRVQDLAPQYGPTVVYKLEPDLPAATVGLVCQGFTCKAPAQTVEQLVEQVQMSQKRG